MRHARCKNKKEEMNFIKDVFEKKGRNWVVKKDSPFVTESHSREHTNHNEFETEARSRLIVEANTTGGAVTDLIFLRLSAS